MADLVASFQKLSLADAEKVSSVMYHLATFRNTNQIPFRLMHPNFHH